MVQNEEYRGPLAAFQFRRGRIIFSSRHSLRHPLSPILTPDTYSDGLTTFGQPFRQEPGDESRKVLTI